jgi:hypothetical protein
MSFSSSVGGALAAAAVTDHPSAPRAFMGAVMGMVIAAANTWLHWRMGGSIKKKLGAEDAKLRWLYLGVCVWVIVAAALAFQITRFALRIAP